MTPGCRRRVGAQGMELIRRFEGYSPVTYLCPAGYPTIGYGHRLSVTERFDRIDRQEAERLLADDLGPVESALDRLVPVVLSAGQFDALASFTYNLGAAALQRSTLRQRVLRGDFDGATDEFSRWTYARGRKLSGLVTRRDAEAQLFMQ